MPLGPMLTYLYAVMSVPFTIGITMILARGMTDFETPLSAFAVTTCAYLLLLVEGISARCRVA